MTLYDISLTISEDLPTWPGDPKIELTKISQIKDGEDGKCDPPVRLCAYRHPRGRSGPFPGQRQNRGKSAVGLLVGEAAVVDIPVEGQISAADLQSAGIPDGTTRLLIKTANSQLWAQDLMEFKEDFIALEADAAAYLVNRGVKVVGVDYLSVAPFVDPAPTHKILLEAGVLIIEGLNLSGIEAGEYTLMCLPLKIKGSDGAPARVLLQKD